MRMRAYSVRGAAFFSGGGFPWARPTKKLVGTLRTRAPCTLACACMRARRVEMRCDVTRNWPRPARSTADMIDQGTRQQSLTAVAVSGGSWQPRPRGPGDHRERRARRLGTLGGGVRRGLGKAPGAHVLVPTDGVTRPRALWIVERRVLSTR